MANGDESWKEGCFLISVLSRCFCPNARISKLYLRNVQSGSFFSDVRLVCLSYLRYLADRRNIYMFICARRDILFFFLEVLTYFTLLVVNAFWRGAARGEKVPWTYLVGLFGKTVWSVKGRMPQWEMRECEQAGLGTDLGGMHVGGFILFYFIWRHHITRREIIFFPCKCKGKT